MLAATKHQNLVQTRITFLTAYNHTLKHMLASSKISMILKSVFLPLETPEINVYSRFIVEFINIYNLLFAVIKFQKKFRLVF